jgi:hypothetical protein
VAEHEHDWGTLIYGQCAYCPLTMEQHLTQEKARIERLVLMCKHADFPQTQIEEATR